MSTQHEQSVNQGLKILKDEFGGEKVDSAINKVRAFEIEIPSWIFGEFGGNRFGGYMPPGCARNVYEKLDDARLVNKLTGATPLVAMHALWDFSEDDDQIDMKQVEDVAQATADRELRIGSISPTYFLKGSHRGSCSSNEEKTRNHYVDQTIQCGEIAGEYGSNLVTLWLPDGSIYPAHVSLGRAYGYMKDSIIRAVEKIDKKVHVLLEYKLFEPGTYSTVIPDWGTSFSIVRDLGDNAGVLVDMGHHAHGVNIEQIVAILIREKMRCGFHFNTRYAADDDHGVEPNVQMARIFNELISGDVLFNQKTSKNWFYMIDQCSSRENRMHAILHSVDSLQLSLAKALLVDSDAIQKYQDNDEIILANRVLNQALIHADVRPILFAARLEKNLPADPVAEYYESDYQAKIETTRK